MCRRIYTSACRSQSKSPQRWSGSSVPNFTARGISPMIHIYTGLYQPCLKLKTKHCETADLCSAEGTTPSQHHQQRQHATVALQLMQSQQASVEPHSRPASGRSGAAAVPVRRGILGPRMLTTRCGGGAPSASVLWGGAAALTCPACYAARARSSPRTAPGCGLSACRASSRQRVSWTRCPSTSCERGNLARRARRRAQTG